VKEKEKGKNGAVYLITDWLCPLLLGVGCMLLIGNAPNDKESLLASFYLLEWPFMAMVIFKIYRYLAKRHWLLSWLRVIPLVVGIGFFLIGVFGISTAQYSAGFDYLGFLYRGDISGSIVAIVETYWRLIIVIAVVWIACILSYRWERK